MMNDILGTRFDSDGKSVMNLNAYQEAARQKINKRIESGDYVYENVHCIVCDSKSFQTLANKDRCGLKTSIVICTKCGLIQTNPRMTKESLEKFYDSDYRNLYNGENKAADVFQDAYRRGEIVYNFICSYAKRKISGKFILDIGCGAGGILSYFKEKNNEILGIDLGTEYLEYGRNKGLDLRTGSFDKMPELNKKPDIVILSHVVEHLPNPIEQLKELKQYLKEDTLIYIEVPSVNNLTISYHHDFLEYLVNAHTYHFTLRTLSNCCQKAGYVILAGNDVTHSIFRIDAVSENFVSDYDDVLSFLKHLESSRTGNLNVFKMRLAASSAIISVLYKTNTVSIASKIYHRLVRKRTFSTSR